MQSIEKTPKNHSRWSASAANAWYAAQPWLVGCNYIPRSAINQLEMWQAGTFDPEIIDQELGWAQHIGFNALRVYLHDKAWQVNPDGFKTRIDWFLKICNSHSILPMFVFFDDCWDPISNIGKQPEPRPGVHNSGWLQSPGKASVNDPSTWPGLEKYVTDILKTFGKDDRILMWDLYNEPGNRDQQNKSLALLAKVFEWARAAGPAQPLSVGLWNWEPDYEELNKLQLAHSDVITFHNYKPADDAAARIADLKQHGRPLICTEYMARTLGSTFEAILPLLKRENIGAINWGFVAGKTNTIFPWQHKEGSPEPEVWFHDILRPDGTPFDSKEVDLIRRLSAGC